MAHELSSPRSEIGRTFTTAVWVLGLVAVAQITAVGWAIATRPPSATPGVPPALSSTPVPTIPTQTPETSSSRPLVVIPTASTPSPPPFPGTEAPATGEMTTTGTPTPSSTRSGSFTLPPMPELIDPNLAPPPAPSNGVSRIATGPSLDASVPALPGPSFDAPAPPLSLSAVLAGAALQPNELLALPNLELAQMLDAGVEKRDGGDMQGALSDLRQVEVTLPDHPRVLSEIAATYSEMGLDRKAMIYWDRVRELGAEGAGAWHAIAVGEMTGQRAFGSAEPRTPQILSLGRVSAAQDQTVTEGERVVVNVVVEADPKSRPVPEEMSMAVFFFDLVDGEKAEPSTADTPPPNWVSAPYDWQTDGRESIEVIYHQPAFTEAQKRELGERRYYGYLIELYYRDQLQDSAAFPPDLESLDPNARPSSLGEPPLGPDNALFPDIPVEVE